MYAFTIVNRFTIDNKLLTRFYSTAEKLLEGIKKTYPNIERDGVYTSLVTRLQDMEIGDIFDEEYLVVMRVVRCTRPYLLDRL